MMTRFVVAHNDSSGRMLRKADVNASDLHGVTNDDACLSDDNHLPAMHETNGN